MSKLRIAIGGMGIESSVFSTHVSGVDDFGVVRGQDLLDRFGELLRDDVEWIPLLSASAMPGGPVDTDFYLQTKEELLGLLRDAGPLDGYYFPIHGAMTVVGRQDAEGDLATAIREIIGPDCLMSASMDPHGNVSPALITALDLLTSHRMSPHEDRHLTEERAVTNLLHCLDNDIRPRRAWVTMPVLLPGELACTRDEPAKGLYGRLPAVEQQDGIIDAAIWIGYAWGDEPRCRGAVVVTGTDETLIQQHTQELAKAWWDARREFGFSVKAGDVDWAIDTGLTSTQRPFFISDSGDNPTAGGSNDVSYTLGKLLANPELESGHKTAIWASVVAPDAVAQCVEAGVGGEVDVEVGGAFGSTINPPVRLTGTVQTLSEGRVRAGRPNRLAVVAAGGVRAILSERRTAFHYMRQFTDLGLDPAAHDITVVKVGYLVPDLFDAAAAWALAVTPGGVDQEIVRLGHQHVQRPIFPLDPDMADPDFTPTLF